MSQFVLDDQLDAVGVLLPIRKWTTAQQLRDLRPNERILDERVPEILLTLKQPSLVTLDQDFWHSRWCNPNHGILCFALREDQQELLPGLLRTEGRCPPQARARKVRRR